MDKCFGERCPNEKSVTIESDGTKTWDYYGYCPNCWLKMTPDQRTILEEANEEEPPQKEVVHYRTEHRVETETEKRGIVYPSVSPWRRWGLRLWIVAVTTALFWLLRK